jgi:exodeoxyribonuclease X
LIRVIDNETTGIDPGTDAIIEIASVDMVRDGGITNAMDTLVRPNKLIPPGASAVHHIVDEDVAHAPAFDEVIDRFRGADFYVAHNCLNWLGRAIGHHFPFARPASLGSPREKTTSSP